MVCQWVFCEIYTTRTRRSSSSCPPCPYPCPGPCPCPCACGCGGEPSPATGSLPPRLFIRRRRAARVDCLFMDGVWRHQSEGVGATAHGSTRPTVGDEFLAVGRGHHHARRLPFNAVHHRAYRVHRLQTIVGKCKLPFNHFIISHQLRLANCVLMRYICIYSCH